MAFYAFSPHENQPSEMLKKQRCIAQASTWTEELKTKTKMSITCMNHGVNKT